MWNRRNSLPPESRRVIGGSVLLHFRAAVRTRASASIKIRPWSWARLAARAALFGAALPGKKRKCLENLFPQPSPEPDHVGPRQPCMGGEQPKAEERETVRPKPKAVLRLPDLEHSKNAVLNSLAAASSRELYGPAIDKFIGWYCSEPRSTCAWPPCGDLLTKPPAPAS